MATVNGQMHAHTQTHFLTFQHRAGLMCLKPFYMSETCTLLTGTVREVSVKVESVEWMCH